MSLPAFVYRKCMNLFAVGILPDLSGIRESHGASAPAAIPGFPGNSRVPGDHSPLSAFHVHNRHGIEMVSPDGCPGLFGFQMAVMNNPAWCLLGCFNFNHV